jgi:hypothetical protein
LFFAKVSALFIRCASGLPGLFTGASSAARIRTAIFHFQLSLFHFRISTFRAVRTVPFDSPIVHSYPIFPHSMLNCLSIMTRMLSSRMNSTHPAQPSRFNKSSFHPFSPGARLSVSPLASQAILTSLLNSLNSFLCHTYKIPVRNSFVCHTSIHKRLKVYCLPHIRAGLPPPPPFLPRPPAQPPARLHFASSCVRFLTGVRFPCFPKHELPKPAFFNIELAGFQGLYLQTLR